MTDHIYKLVHLTGTSTTGIEDAVHNAIKRAAKSIHNMRWFEIIETRGHIDHNTVQHWQVTLKVGFTLEDESI